MTGAAGRPWSSSLAVRLTLGLLIATLLGTGAMGLYVTRAIEAHGVAELEARLAAQARLLRDVFVSAVGVRTPTSSLQALARTYGQRLEARVTVIAADGTVLADSERDEAGVRVMENHAGRPEVRAALAGAVGRDLRRSGTLGVEMLYVAVSVTNGCEYCIASHTAAARAKGMTDEQHGELLAVVGMANETNALANGLAVPVDEAFKTLSGPAT